MSVDLSRESKDLLSGYVDNGFLSKDKIHDLWKASNKKSFVSIMSVVYDLHQSDIDVVWRFIRTKVWKGISNRDDLLTIFNEQESFVFEKLLQNNGFISHVDLLKKVVPTPYMAKKTMENLCRANFVDKIILSTNEVYYLLNMKFHSDCYEEKN